ncbi:MAG: ribosome biogenesis GTPase Der, partial [candidate division Zixibacteria bacterium]|nr:ribosome biogenesis GTPase Der [candidate division Zixibacteria bacterium]
MLRRVILLGRPNVGKSTLFNRLLGRRVAMTDVEPHTTRDILAGLCRCGDARLELVDAAGFLVSPEDTLEQSIKRGLDAAAASADVVVLVFDGREGLLPLDRELADFARRLNKPVIPVVNKIDSPSLLAGVGEFYELGFEREPRPVSAANGYNCRQLLEAVVEELGPGAEEAEEAGEERLCVAIVGRPNVGKSSLLNRLAGGERVVVHESPGTTRDAVDVDVDFEGRELVFVDTAGIRRRARAKKRLELWSLGKAFAAIRRASVVVLVLDGAEGPTSQDAKIAAYADRHGRGLIIFLNKTDLLDDDDALRSRSDDVRAELGFAPYASIRAGSALRGFDARALYRAIFEVDENRRTRVGTGELNRFLGEAMARRKFRVG